MLESLEGKRGVIRAKPPIPALVGLFGRPTVVNNVLTLGTVPMILADGGAAYAALGVGRSRGTQVFQLGGNLAHGGIVETAFGITLGELVNGYGGGTASGRPLRAVQVGGPLGAYLPVEQLDLAMDYEAFAAAGAMVGHGGIVAFDDTVDMARQARFAMEFCAEESCGKCTPCRIGSVRGVEVIDRIIADDEPRGQPRCAGRPLRPHGRRFAVRDGRADPDARPQRAAPLRRGLRQARGRAADAPPGRARRPAPGPHTTPARSRRRSRHEPAQRAGPGHTRPGRRADGRGRDRRPPVNVPEGTSVMRAAALAGIDVPKLCATDSLEPFGSCRLCLVEIDGAKGTPASCTTPCAAGMKVTTPAPSSTSSAAA